MLRKRIRILNNKKADSPVLNWIVESMPKIVLFIVVFGLIISAWYGWGTTKKTSQPARDIQRIATEINQLSEEKETVTVPIFGEEYELALFGKGDTHERRCKKKGCICAYDAKDGELIDCITFDSIGKEGETAYYFEETLVEIGKQKDIETEGIKEKELHVVKIEVDGRKISIS